MDEVEAVEPEKVVEEEEDGTKRKILTRIRRIPPTKNSYSPYYKVLNRGDLTEKANKNISNSVILNLVASLCFSQLNAFILC